MTPIPDAQAGPPEKDDRPKKMSDEELWAFVVTNANMALRQEITAEEWESELTSRGI